MVVSLLDFVISSFKNGWFQSNLLNPTWQRLSASQILARYYSYAKR